MNTATRLFDIEDALDSDAWYTPGWVFKGLGIEFDIDVAAPSDQLPWLPARRRYTVTDDGLAQLWYGIVWCNPPYSDPKPWCIKWAAHPEGLLLIRSGPVNPRPLCRLRCRVVRLCARQANPVR